MGLTELMTKNNKMIKKPITKSIYLDDIKTNDLNIEEMIDIEELKQSIQSIGLMHPLEVIKKEDYYSLVGGHRRFTALKELIEQGLYPDDEIPCLVYIFENEVEERLAMLVSNSTRTTTKEMMLKRTKEVLDLLEVEPALKAPGILTRDYVASVIGTSARTVQKYITEIKEPSDKKEKNEKEYDLATLKKDVNKIYKLIEKTYLSLNELELATEDISVRADNTTASFDDVYKGLLERTRLIKELTEIYEPKKNDLEL